MISILYKINYDDEETGNNKKTSNYCCYCYEYNNCLSDQVLQHEKKK